MLASHVPRSARPWALAIAATLAGCPAPTSTTPPDPPKSTAPASVFSGTAALARVRALLEWPRTLGDPHRTASIDALARELAAVGADEVVLVPHEATGPDGYTYALVEIVGHVRPQAQRRFVLATHFDTRPWADEEPDPTLRGRPVPGANDGTSGVAVVLELVPLFARGLPDDVGVSIVLFDGEELGRPGDPDGYCMGSRFLAGAIDAGEHPLLARAELGIVLDMVGDVDLSLPIEPGSLRNAPALVEHVWATAESLGVAQFDRTPRERAVLDDHKFLTAAGIPSILIIDREYAAWHTTHDTIDQVSAESLAAVGEVVRVAVMRWFETRAARGTLGG
jgi:glutaminyl-peptide cyclotransferase